MIDFYYDTSSAPCRAVLLTAKALNIQLNLIVVDLMNEEQFQPEFTKINPQHTVPTIDDNGFYLWESRAIITYLVNKYGVSDSLYPKSLRERALIDQRLYFDATTLYPRFAACYYPVLYHDELVDRDGIMKLTEAFEFLDGFLEKSEFVAGDHLTVADFSLVATVSTAIALDFSILSFKNVTRWLTKMKTTAIGYEHANEKGVQMVKLLWQQKMQQ